MKKLISIFLIAIVAMFAVSCKDGPAIIYDVDIIGDCDGNVTVTFPDGNLVLNGTADLNFTYSNGNTDQVDAYVYDLKNALFSSNDQVRQFATDVAEQFDVTSASGTYYVSIKGYVKQPDSGIVIAIDKTFTNRENHNCINEGVIDSRFVDSTEVR